MGPLYAQFLMFLSLCGLEIVPYQYLPASSKDNLELKIQCLVKKHNKMPINSYYNCLTTFTVTSKYPMTEL